MQEITKIAKKYNLHIIEDAAHAIGSVYKDSQVGSCQYSDLTTFSFHPVKTITTAEGGAITTNNLELYNKLLALRTHGIVQKPDIAPWYYEMQTLGYNYRLPDVLAALGTAQLTKLDKFVTKRRELVDAYRQAFTSDPRFRILVERTYNHSAFHLCPLLINFSSLKISKSDLFLKLRERGLNLQVHYIPVHLQPYYQKLGFKSGDYPDAEAFYAQEISLPLYPTLKGPDIKNIVKITKELCQ